MNRLPTDFHRPSAQKLELEIARQGVTKFELADSCGLHSGAWSRRVRAAPGPRSGRFLNVFQAAWSRAGPGRTPPHSHAPAAPLPQTCVRHPATALAGWEYGSGRVRACRRGLGQRTVSVSTHTRL